MYVFKAFKFGLLQQKRIQQIVIKQLLNGENKNLCDISKRNGRETIIAIIIKVGI